MDRAPSLARKERRLKLVRMTKPNFVSSHDWHVQLCCQRSGLHPPERAALDQGLIGISQICVLELDALFIVCYCRSVGSLELLSLALFRPSRIASAADDVLANFSRLSIFTLLVKLFFAFSEVFFQRKQEPNHVRTAQNFKTS